MVYIGGHGHSHYFRQQAGSNTIAYNEYVIYS